jgi:hypothetical protein
VAAQLTNPNTSSIHMGKINVFPARILDTPTLFVNFISRLVLDAWYASSMVMRQKVRQGTQWLEETKGKESKTETETVTTPSPDPEPLGDRDAQVTNCK